MLRRSFASGARVRFLSNAEMRERGLPRAFVCGVLEENGGHLHPGRYVAGLRRAALASGVRLYEDTSVSSLERGYYVFPVALIDAFMKDNGLPTPGEMHQASLSKIAEIIDPDAVLYITIAEWGQKYQVLSSNTVVNLKGRLVDVDSGTTIWSGGVRAVEESESSGDLVADLIGAVVEQVLDSVIDQTRPLARKANSLMIYDRNKGLLVGPLSPSFGVTEQ